jgi:ubiquitin-protein ligase E3 C
LERIAGVLQPGLKFLLCKEDIFWRKKSVSGVVIQHEDTTIGTVFEKILLEFLSSLMACSYGSNKKHDMDNDNDGSGGNIITTTPVVPSRALPHKDRFLLYHRILVYCLQRLNTATTKNDQAKQQYKVYMDAIVFFLHHLPADTVYSMLQHGRLASRVEVEYLNLGRWILLSPLEVELLQCLKTWMWNGNGMVSCDDIWGSFRDGIVVQLLQVCGDVVLFHESHPIHSSSSGGGGGGGIGKIFQGYLAMIVLGVEIKLSRPLIKQYLSLREKTTKNQVGDQSSNSVHVHIWRWYCVLVQDFMTSILLNQSVNNENGMMLDRRHPPSLLSWKKHDIVQLMTGREFVYIQNMSEILSMSKQLGTVEENKLVKVWFLKFVGHLLDPLWMVELSNVGSEGNTSRELYCLMSLSSLVARGMDVLSIVRGNRSMDIEPVMTEENEEDEDDNENEDNNPHDQNMDTASSRTGSKGSNYKLGRQDLQTVDKLDRLYKFNMAKAQSDIIGWLREQPSEFATKMCEVAMMIGHGDVITQLIPTIFDASTHRDLRDEEKEIFCNILSCLLQNCCGAKARDSAVSPLLSTLAFRPGFLQELWHYTKFRVLFYNDHVRGNNAFTGIQSLREAVEMYSSVTNFCDIFSHHLLAIDDEEFLGSFTETYHGDTVKGGILVAEVINLLKSLLYDMYWSRPVVAADFTVPQSRETLDCADVEKFHRARLFLSGTKLWNCIYTRWSRLFRLVIFCDEESWWFPHLVTRHDDESGAMDHRTASMNQDMDEEDEQSIDSRMEIDENVHAEGRDESEALASSFKDPKMARILTSVPQALPFERRAKLFSSLLAADIAKTQDESAAMREMMWNMQQGIEGAEYRGREKVRIRRDKLYSDSMSQISELGRRLKKKVQVTFISKHGNEEAGVDGGGLFKEFLDDLIKDAFNPKMSRDGIAGPLFIETPLQTLAVNTNLRPSPLTLSHYRFLGRVLGKAVYESILVEPQFCLPFLNQLLGQHNTVDDLKNIDPVYHKHLCSLRKMGSEEIASLGLTFELTVSLDDGKSSRTIELIPGGSSLLVTGENVIRYLHLVAHRRLNVETARQTTEFLSGFRDLIPASWVRLFSPYELQKVISGDNTVHGFDVKGLKNVMLYGGGYHPSQPIIQWFWEIVEEMSPTQKSKLLKFMTSCSRQPLLGFGHLSPLPCIHQVRLGDDDEEQRLPTSATCMHLLKLPNYRSKSVLKDKLLYAIESGAGFELS